MQTIDSHPIRFGELAGPLVHGSLFFDWELVSTQEITAAVGHRFQDIVASGGIPYAPVVASTSVHRYPTFEDTVSVETVPIHVGDSSVELVYEMTDGNGDPVATGRLTHVTIAPEGGALELPNATREAYADQLVDRDPAVGPDAPQVKADGAGRVDETGDVDEADDRLETDADALPTFSASFPVRSPHIESSELAYFEEYPSFADAALEAFLEDSGTSLDALSGERQPFRIADWQWEFSSPVPFESTLRVDADVRAVDSEAVRIEHTLSSDGTPSIEGITEYGCFDRSGERVPFTEDALEPFRSV
ncbi:Acyl-CoA thioesterase FadM [Halopenitus malekzadehii]|uniref:Acyl-CoA thioesterase FadM n=1 Tax=Halopenitus malekzadehii TaxID=1267564 RepID=A0A1H6HV28_9EURY|nr:acyl-[acyl-carrier-protein] thioesterase [Halopenitus malekzadehii]SEH37989.1 Acyl-CoA thioesterase FadM [Halopenitus malekzadehii]